ncbi:hypothetical protein [Bacillus massilinigeriensis]|uniref:hypothetical protein n=1 Tax=Bacillus massilionigeriensis TaxID=1805475 RepID=UPI00096B2529|nr:hypothetical protein [Bacillus massilionigeriensis]
MIKYLGFHETLEVHELITAKNLSLTKSATMSKLAQDPELKSILEEEVTKATNHIQQLQNFITNREEQQ